MFIKHSLENIKKEIEDLALKIKAPTNLFPKFEYWDNHTFIEVDSLGLIHLVFVERGQELNRKMSDNIDDILYWIFCDIAFSMAVSERNNSIDYRNNRRVIIQKKQIELLEILNECWKNKKEKELSYNNF